MVITFSADEVQKILEKYLQDCLNKKIRTFQMFSENFDVKGSEDRLMKIDLIIEDKYLE